MDTSHRLTSHKISSIVVDSMEDCAMACFVQRECFSFNLGNPSKAGKHECELLRTDKYNSNSTCSHSRLSPFLYKGEFLDSVHNRREEFENAAYFYGFV